MVCLETTFIVDLLRGNKDAEAMINRLDNGSDAACIATPTVMEIVSGAELEKSGREREKASDLFSRLIVLPLDKESSILAGKIEASLIMSGELIESKDIMIAAIALRNGEKLITRNIKHFQKIKGLEIESY